MSKEKSSKEKTLRDQLNALLRRDQLDAHERADLLRRLNTPALQVNRPTRRAPWFWASGAAVASIVIALIVVGWPLLNGASPGVVALMADEVATNHVHHKPLDVNTPSFSELRNALSLLNFVPRAPSLLNRTNLALVGGRYCTLRGVIATQIIFVDDDSRRITLYQAAYSKERFGSLPGVQDPLKFEHHGLTMRMWVEAGVVMALAWEPAHAASSGVLL